MIDIVDIGCPYCGETFSTTIDCSPGSQSYVEDCQVCCQPIVFHIAIDFNGHLTTVTTLRENE